MFTMERDRLTFFVFGQLSIIYSSYKTDLKSNYISFYTQFSSEISDSRETNNSLIHFPPKALSRLQFIHLLTDTS